MSRIVDAQPWHLLSVALRLPERDMREAAALGYRSVQDVAVRRAAEAGVKFAILDEKGDPQVCFGVTESATPGVGVLWMLRAIGSEAFVKTGARAVREIAKSGEYRRIETYSQADCTRCRKLIEWLGFSYECTKRAFFTDGTDMDQFSIVGQR